MKSLKGSKTQTLAVIISFFIVGMLLFMSFFGSEISPNSPISSHLIDRLKPPVWVDGGNWKYPLGTDSIGRCILSRIIAGTKYALGISLAAIIISAVIGVIMGLVSGYYGGIVDAAIMRMVDLTLSFPLLLLGLLMAMTMGQSPLTLIAVMVFVQTGRFARLIRGETLKLKRSEFVDLAKIAGCSKMRILYRHLFPNVVNILLVLMTLQIGWAIVVESSLSFLGAGIPPPAPGWGLMVSEGREYIASAWWVSLLPGTAIMLTVLAFNTIGDWMRDRFDPRLRQL